MNKIPHTRPYFPAEMIQGITQDIEGILTSGRLMMGPYRDKAESDFSRHLGIKHAVTLNSATTGLQIALRYAGCRGKDVLIPAASFLTDLSAVLMEGGNPILVDCDPETLAIDPEDIRRKISDRTAAILWVHLTGYITDRYQELQDLARDAGAMLIEDASHAHGAEIDGKRAGTLGDVGVFSFYPTKILTAGTGGILTTADDALATFAREMRIFGKQETTGEIIHLGNDWFLDEIRACVVSHQIAAMGEIGEKRRAAAQHYAQRLSNCPGIRIYRPRDRHAPGWYQYPILFDDAKTATAAIDALKRSGIDCKKIYKPLHEEQVFRSLPADGIDNAADLLARAVCLPMMTDITSDELNAVCDAILDFCETHCA